MGLAGVPLAHQRRRGRGEAGIAGLADLDPAVLDELRRDQARGRCQDDAADRPFGGEDGADPGCGLDRQVLRPQQPPFQH
jgi:hypothetical protein